MKEQQRLCDLSDEELQDLIILSEKARAQQRVFAWDIETNNLDMVTITTPNGQTVNIGAVEALAAIDQYNNKASLIAVKAEGLIKMRGIYARLRAKGINPDEV